MLNRRRTKRMSSNGLERKCTTHSNLDKRDFRLQDSDDVVSGVPLVLSYLSLVSLPCLPLIHTIFKLTFGQTTDQTPTVHFLAP